MVLHLCIGIFHIWYLVCQKVVGRYVVMLHKPVSLLRNFVAACTFIVQSFRFQVLRGFCGRIAVSGSSFKRISESTRDINATAPDVEPTNVNRIW